MSNYNNLKSSINNNIYENQTQQITGTVLNAILNEMTNALGAGYQFAGVATVGMTPSEPDARIFYLAGEGIYTSFDGIQVPAGKLGILKWDNRWHLETIDGLGSGGANLTGYVTVASTDDLPDEGVATLGYLCGTNLYLYVGEGGDTKEGKYQDCGSFRGPQGDSVQDVEQTQTSLENGGVNKIKFSLSNGISCEFQVRNGTTSSGLFPTLEALQAAYPSPVVGQYAFVGAGFPADIYVCTTAGTWTDSGEDYDGDNVDLTDYATKAEVNQLEAKDDEIEKFLNPYRNKSGYIAGDYARTSFVGFNGKEGDTVFISFNTAYNGVGLRITFSDSTTQEVVADSTLKYNNSILLTKDISTVQVVYGDVRNLVMFSFQDFFTTDETYNKTELDSSIGIDTSFFGAIARGTSKPLSIEKGTTVIYSVKGNPLSALRFNNSGITVREIGIPSGKYEISGTFKTITPLTDISAAYGDVSVRIVVVSELITKDEAFVSSGVFGSAVGDFARAAEISINAKAGDSIIFGFNGVSGSGIRFKTFGYNGEEYLVPDGESGFSKTVVLERDITTVQVINGDITGFYLYAKSGTTALIPLPKYAPTPQLPANNDNDSDFNAETITPTELYSAFDSLIATTPIPSFVERNFPKYITKYPIIGKDATNVYDICAYVLCQRDRFAWVATHKLYAWKNGDTVVYIDSVAPMVGGIIYSDSERTQSGKTIVSVDNLNRQFVDSLSVTYTASPEDNINADVFYTGIVPMWNTTPGATIAAFDKQDNVLGQAVVVNSTTMTLSEKTYTRYDAFDRNSKQKATITIWGNEHGPQSDPAEPAIILYRMAKDLLGNCANNEFLSFLKNYVKLIFIPCSNPYGLQNHTRNNGNDVNINRNYDTPGWASQNDADKGTYGGSEPETQFNMNVAAAVGSDIAIDIHCLGYVTRLNEGKCHWRGKVDNNLNKRIAPVMFGLGFDYTEYGASNYNSAAEGSEWITFAGMRGCLIEMNAGPYSAEFNGEQHTAHYLSADYTLLLQILNMYLDN